MFPNGVENFIHEWSKELTPDPEYLTNFRTGVLSERLLIGDRQPSAKFASGVVQFPQAPSRESSKLD